MPRHAERRLYPRRNLRTAVTFEDEFGEGIFYVFSHDISEGGMCLDADDLPARIGSLMFLSFALPKSRQHIRVTGEVVRARALGIPGSGIGVRFVGPPLETVERLRRFLERP